MKKIFFRYPLSSETLDSWAKMLEDIAKTVIIALPAVILFGSYSTAMRWFMAVSMIVVLALCIWNANALRHIAQKRKEKPCCPTQ